MVFSDAYYLEITSCFNCLLYIPLDFHALFTREGQIGGLDIKEHLHLHLVKNYSKSL